MRFDDLLALVRSRDLDDDAHRPAREDVREVQHALSAWLADEEFYLDVVELELAAIRGTDRRAAMFRMPDRPLMFQMFYWWPGRVATPHEHTKWTVTAVFFNRLQVTTYDWDVAFRQRRLEKKNVFAAEQGKAGHIYDRCIHNPANATNRDSMSIHIFNVLDAQRIEDEVGPIAGLASPTGRGRESPDARRQRQLRVLAQAACQFHSPRASILVDHILESGDGETCARIDRMRWRAARAG
jgi:predicted metal-dependent enzyme (double-stranded beta helix superfamily)